MKKMDEPLAESQVHVWEEDVEIPTYGTGEPDKNPMFLEKRVYQGSSGRVYPCWTFAARFFCSITPA